MVGHKLFRDMKGIMALVQPIILWFRQDLRLSDHVALMTAVHEKAPILPVFILDDRLEVKGSWAMGAASRWWLHHSLKTLDHSLRRLGSRLVLRKGCAKTILIELCNSFGAQAVFASHMIEPEAQKRDKCVADALAVPMRLFEGACLYPPGEIRTRQGGIYQVFTPFWKAILARPDPPAPLASPDHLFVPKVWPESAALDDLALLPRHDWASGLDAHWDVGEKAAHKRLAAFLEDDISAYIQARDRPDRAGTSGLSPHVHFGEISPRQLWHRAQAACFRMDAAKEGAQAFLRQVAWREFAYHLLAHIPGLPESPMRPAFATFPWEKNETGLRAWQRGQTGYPIVDAGMRQLWQTGTMHNRVRMIVASFLVKDLMIHWHAGARWFWDTLVDADLANNSMGWQWVAGCGPDAAPFFRIFNPVSQGQTHDPQAAYIRHYVPEIAALPARYIYQPWTAPASVLDKAGILLGTHYPFPIVDHQKARQRALQGYKEMKKTM
ncbi:deoxyribodipyrimidine photo-lyase [Iodidimonas gelatinilytica]|uniref:Deoxyribodipyrimidine photo-lyase n=3 Tax=Iodidimonas gelatinilytica TaxID=1236966 RepID=A0A5A7MNL9_9PROT|nr:deoxyribodipyrimidine photo-lyase [Iodidimonas gelatinilytica]